MRWGLIPAFINDPASISPMFNAKAETLAELRSFEDLILTSRCLILNRGYYEHERQGDEQICWKISPAQEYFFYKAGLWTAWHNPQTNEIIESHTMITCDPKETAVSKVHNRMPVILNKAQRRLWMNPSASKLQLLQLLQPCDASTYSITEFSRKPVKVPKSKNR